MNNWQQTVPDQSWDDRLFTAGGHFLQSSHWAAMQQAMGKRVFTAQGDGWQCLAIAGSNRLYCPYGPFIEKREALPQALAALQALARHLRAHYIRIEPTGALSHQALSNLGLKIAHHDVQPHYTIIQDLRGGLESVFAAGSQSNRRLWRKSEEIGLTYRTSTDPNDLRIFLPMLHEVTDRTRIHQHPDSYFEAAVAALFPRQAASFHFAYLHGKPVAGILSFDSPSTSSYMYVGSYNEYRKLSPTVFLTYKLMDWAIQHGKQYLDFHGVAPPDQPEHEWNGFTRFKHSFGGIVHKYVGTWELPIKPLQYTAYRLAQKAKKILPG